MISFAKYSGCGNDFIMIDNRSQIFPTHHKILVPQLCHRRTGIGADGVILLENAPSADFRMRIFNSDGSEAEMCGNGIRCLIKFIRELGSSKAHFKIATMLTTLSIDLKGDNVQVNMGKPFDIRWNIPLIIDGTTHTVQHVNTGVPHAILFVKDCHHIDVANLGPKIRHHTLFAPQGANANFVSINKGELWIRTFERGVEEETLACGTGATAAAIAASVIQGLKSPIKIHTKSKDILEIGFIGNGSSFDNVTLTGPAIKVFQGEFRVEDNSLLQ